MPQLCKHTNSICIFCASFPPSDTLEVSSNQPPLGSTHCTHTILTPELLKDTHLPGPRTAIKAISSFLRQVKSKVLTWEFWFELCKREDSTEENKKSEEDRKEQNPTHCCWRGHFTKETVWAAHRWASDFWWDKRDWYIKEFKRLDSSPKPWPWDLMEALEKVVKTEMEGPHTALWMCVPLCVGVCEDTSVRSAFPVVHSVTSGSKYRDKRRKKRKSYHEIQLELVRV